MGQPHGHRRGRRLAKAALKEDADPASHDQNLASTWEKVGGENTKEAVDADGPASNVGGGNWVVVEYQGKVGGRHLAYEIAREYKIDPEDVEFMRLRKGERVLLNRSLTLGYPEIRRVRG